MDVEKISGSGEEGPAHGTRYRYQSPRWRCRCLECKAAQRLYRQSRNDSDGEAVLIDGAQVRNRLLELKDAGKTLSGISKAAGVSRDSILRLIKDDSSEGHPRVSRVVAEKILNIPTEDIETDKWIDVSESRNRLSELLSRGWKQSELSTKLGFARKNAIHHIVSGRSKRISRQLAESIAKLYIECGFPQRVYQPEDEPGDAISQETLGTHEAQEDSHGGSYSAESHHDESAGPVDVGSTGSTVSIHWVMSDLSGAFLQQDDTGGVAAEVQDIEEPSLENGYRDPVYELRSLFASLP